MIGQECTITAYQHIRIGEQCVIADRAMFIDFDHGVVEVERPIREQGIYKRDVEVGSNVWIGYGACILRGVSVGDNSVIGTNSVVTRDVPANAVVGGIPARVLRMREAPERLRWPRPVEPDPEAATTLPLPSRRRPSRRKGSRSPPPPLRLALGAEPADAAFGDRPDLLAGGGVELTGDDAFGAEFAQDAGDVGGFAFERGGDGERGAVVIGAARLGEHGEDRGLLGAQFAGGGVGRRPRRRRGRRASGPR